MLYGGPALADALSALFVIAMTHKYAKNKMREDNKEGTKPKNKDNILDIAIATFLKSYQFFVNIYKTIYSLPNTFGLRNFVVAVTQEIDGFFIS